MGRRGWSAVPIPESWVQVIRGPRPKSEVWPRAKSAQKVPQEPGRWRNSSRADSSKVRSLEIALNSLNPEESGARVELHAALRRAKEVTQKPLQRSSTTPDARVAEARVKVAKLEKALEALEGTDGVEVDAIKKALVKAKVAAHEKHVSEQIADCKSFIDRAEKRLVKLDAERESEHALLEEGRARLARLEADVAASVPLPRGPCCSDGSSVVAPSSRVSRRTHNGSPTPQSSPGGPRPQHCGRGCTANAIQAARHGGNDCPRFRRGCFQARDRRGSNSVASVDTTTFVCGERGELSHVSEVAPRIRTLYGFRGQRIGEASNPGPASRRRRTQRLRDLQRDSESEDECRHVARRLEGDGQPLVELTPPTWISCPKARPAKLSAT